MSQENLPSKSHITTSNKHGIGVQLIIFGDEERDNLDATICKCKQLGYAFVEGTLNLMDVPASNVRQITSCHQIPVRSVHVGFPDIESRANLDRALNYMLEIGATTLICSGQSAASADPVYVATKTSEKLNQAGEYCSTHGVKLYVHCFDWVYRQSGGTTLFEELLRRTNSDCVHFNIDLGWAHLGGCDPLKALSIAGSRCDYVHLKDVKRDVDMQREAVAVGWTMFCPLGEGCLRLEHCLRALMAREPQPAFVVEQDVPVISPEGDLQKSRQFLLQFGL
jgi:sugar phosphate isomerase/epimerase